jgi:hypothetical protein
LLLWFAALSLKALGIAVVASWFAVMVWAVVMSIYH